MSEQEAAAAGAFNEAQRQRIGLDRDAPIPAPWETFIIEFAFVDDDMTADQRQAADAFNQRQHDSIGRQADSPCIPSWGLFVVEFAVTEDGLSADQQAAAEAFNAAQRARIGAGADAVGDWDGPVFLIEFAAVSGGLSDEARLAAESFNAEQMLAIDEQENAFWAPAFETYLVELAVTDARMAAEVRAGAEAFNATQMERLVDQQTARWRPDGDTFRIDFLEITPDLDQDARLAAESFNADQTGAIDGQLSSYWEPVWDAFLLDFTAISNRLTAAEKQDAKEHNVMVRNTLGDEVEAAEWANRIWSKRTRFIGVGAMVIGGLWALLRLWKSLVRGIASGLAAYRALHDEETVVKRTDRDTPMQWVGIVLILSVIPLFFVFNHVTGDIGTSVFMAVAMLIAGFLFSAVASYMAGLVGSSNNPISGVTIATLLTSALLLLALGTDTATGPAAAILIGAVVCCAAAIGGDNMQDLKSGRIVGATPYKQQVMQAVGVIAAALVMAPVLSALLRAYGIGEITVAGQEPLEAPQASLMQSVAVGVFEQNLPWTLVWTGMVVAAAIIILDLVLEARGAKFRTPVLAVAVGIYLPLELSVPILLGGLVSLAAHRYHVRRSSPAEIEDTAARNGLLLAAGLITGEAMLGILLAIPLAIWEGENRIADTFGDWTGLEDPLWWPGLILLGFVLVILYRVARGK
ncbi:MAG: OPT family oligopeptide transporter [Planctomycetota bacterium]